LKAFSNEKDVLTAFSNEGVAIEISIDGVFQQRGKRRRFPDQRQEFRFSVTALFGETKIQISGSKTEIGVLAIVSTAILFKQD